MLPAEFTTGTIEGTFDSEDPLGCGVAVPFERSRVMAATRLPSSADG